MRSVRLMWNQTDRSFKWRCLGASLLLLAWIAQNAFVAFHKAEVDRAQYSQMMIKLSMASLQNWVPAILTAQGGLVIGNTAEVSANEYLKAYKNLILLTTDWIGVSAMERFVQKDLRDSAFSLVDRGASSRFVAQHVSDFERQMADIEQYLIDSARDQATKGRNWNLVFATLYLLGTLGVAWGVITKEIAQARNSAH